MAREPAASSIDEYIAQFPPATREALRELRSLIRATAPGVSERIRYGIPTFDLYGRYLVYVAGFKEHVSLYPITGVVAEVFAEELEPYRSGKGTARFALGEPLPLDLIRQIVRIKVEEAEARSSRSRAGRKPTAAAKGRASPRPASKRAASQAPASKESAPGGTRSEAPASKGSSAKRPAPKAQPRRRRST